MNFRPAIAAALILANGVTAADYLARFPHQPNLRPLDPWEQVALGYSLDIQEFELLADFAYYSDRVGWIVVPKGFVTDLASIPQFAQSFLQNDSPVILCAAIVHDYLYTVAGKLQSGGWATFRVVNKILCEAMWYLNSTALQRAAVYRAVQSCGYGKWNANCDRLGCPERKV